MNKKAIIIVLIIIIAIGGYFLFFTKNNNYFDKAISLFYCAKEGERIGASGMPNSCCPGLKPVGGWPSGYSGDCA